MFEEKNLTVEDFLNLSEKDRLFLVKPHRDLLLFCNDCKTVSKHYKRNLKCLTCQAKQSLVNKENYRLKHLRNYPVKKCSFPNCDHLFKPRLPSQKFCNIKHMVKCKICNSNFITTSKYYKNTCSIDCQIKYNEQIFMKNYGVNNPSKFPEIREKISMVLSSSEKCIYSEKRKLKNMEKYGVPYHTQSEVIKKKILKTHIDKHGGLGFASPSIKQKIEKSILKKYGVTNISKSENFNEIFKNSIYNKYGVYYKNFQKKKSRGEIDLSNYISKIYSGRVILNDRTLLNGREVDIYLPDLNLAIEYNGDYWHRDQKIYSNNKQLKPSKIQQIKQQRSFEKNVLLIFIWEKDWMNNNSLTKRRILNIIDSAKKNGSLF